MTQPTPLPPGRPLRNPRKQAIALGVLYVGLVALALWVLRDFIPAIAWACVIAIALWPALRRIESYPGLRGRTTLISAIMTAAVALLFLLPIGIGIARAIGEASQLHDWLRGVQQNGFPLPDFVNRLPFGSHQIAAWWDANLARPLRAATAAKSVGGQTVITFGKLFGVRLLHGVALFGFTLITLFVIFQAGPRLSGALLRGAQRAFGDVGASLIQRMAAAVYGTVSGLIVVGLGEGALLAVAYAICGVPHAALLGCVTAVAAMLPFCAPIVFCAAALWLALQGSLVWAGVLAAFGFLVVFVAEHFVRPVLIGNSVRLPFLLVLFGILGGAETFGLLGLFIGPALMTVLTVLWAEWVG